MNALKFLFGFAVGLGLGWAVGSLLAPRSGQETQSLVREKIDAVLEEGRRAAEVTRAEMEAQLAAHRAPRPAGSPP